MERASATRCIWPPESAEARGQQGASADHVQGLIRFALNLLLGSLLRPQTECHIGAHGAVGPDCIRLEDHPNIATVGSYVLAPRRVEDDVAADAQAPS